LARRAPDAAWDLLLICVAAHVLGAVGRIHQLFPVLLPLKPVVTGLAAGALYVLDPHAPRRLAAVRGPTTNCVLLLLLWIGLSVPGALFPGLAFQELISFLKTVVMYLLIVGCVRAFRDVERLALTYFAAAAVYSLVVLARFRVGGDAWRLAGLYYYDANDLATFVVSALPLGLYFVAGQHRWSKRLACAAGMIAIAVAFVWSGSRGGFLALLAVAVFVVFRFTAIRRTTRIVGTAAVVVTVLATASDAYWTQMRTILKPDEDYNRTEDAGRWKIWQRGIGYMKLHPILGVGAQNFSVAEGTISPLAKRQEMGIAVRWGAAHNSFVQAGADLGIPGLLFFVGMLVAAFAALTRVARASGVATGPPDQSRQLAQALMASLIGWAVGAFFLSLAYAEMGYALVGLAAAMHKVATPRQSSPAGHRRSSPTR